MLQLVLHLTFLKFPPRSCENLIIKIDGSSDFCWRLEFRVRKSRATEFERAFAPGSWKFAVEEEDRANSIQEIPAIRLQQVGPVRKNCI